MFDLIKNFSLKIFWRKIQRFKEKTVSVKVFVNSFFFPPSDFHWDQKSQFFRSVAFEDHILTPFCPFFLQYVIEDWNE